MIPGLRFAGRGGNRGPLAGIPAHDERHDDDGDPRPGDALVPAGVAARRSAARYLFSYRIRITNQGDGVVQLLRRHWTITDGTGRVEEVDGAGVVGETPVLRPGASFEYTSFCPLPTPFGTMRGSYLMRAEGGGDFAVEIAPFSLIAPQAVN